MENVRETFKALETIARATKQDQKLNFYLKGSKFEFNVSYYKADETTGDEDYLIASVCKWGESMNVDKITAKAMSLYTFNMLGRKITEKVLLENITLEK